jgi:hypothetical protein
VTSPALALAEKLDAVGVKRFSQFAQHGLARAFATIDVALWHLPTAASLIDSAQDQDLAESIDGNNSYA